MKKIKMKFLYVYFVICGVCMAVAFLYCTNRQTNIPQKSASQKIIEQSVQWIEGGNYSWAIRELERISAEDNLFQDAQALILQADSLHKVQEELKAIEGLKRELDTIQAGIDFSNTEVRMKGWSPH